MRWWAPLGSVATLAALTAGKRVALANKETLVMAGQIVTDTARRHGGALVPVDSEHPRSCNAWPAENPPTCDG